MKHLVTREFNAILAFAFCLGFNGFIAAGEPAGASKPEPVPLTRDDMKHALDASKESIPRLPLPPVTEEEKTLIEEQKAKAAQTGEKPRRLGLANNGRMRAYYLAEYGFKRTGDLERARTGATRDGESSFDPAFRTTLFWIVSRGNNCIYCLGHQESTLATRGLTDDQLAALDGDWSEFDAAKRAAFTFAAKLSFEPHAINDSDFEAIRKHYNESQITEIVLAVAGFNATNRWTGPLRIKQDVLFQFVRPTSPNYASAVSRIAPMKAAATDKGFATPKSHERPPLESRAEVEATLKIARERTPRLKLADVATTKALLSGETATVTVEQWMQLLATLPKVGADRITSYQAVLNKGTLDPRSKAIIAYVGARHDRAWYALGHAIQRLKGQGFSDDQIFALDQPEKLASPIDREIVQFAEKITVDPALITDDDFARMRKLYDDKKVAEVVYVTTQAAFFDRLTE
ncbi:MAG: Carboxymuconolactone decarboxylase family protein, partial [Planctomycetaceae bacterium]|nr:Carboxymuconolactone decarboxylase family protein [Planctomycetaceae bacterium]